MRYTEVFNSSVIYFKKKQRDQGREMASQNPGQVPGQAQMMRRDDTMNQGQNKGVLEETGTQVKNMAQGAADVGKGAAQGTVGIARGAALGAANVAQGAADVMKNTFGHADNRNTNPGSNMNNPANANSASNPSNPSNATQI